MSAHSLSTSLRQTGGWRFPVLRYIFRCLLAVTAGASSFCDSVTFAREDPPPRIIKEALPQALPQEVPEPPAPPEADGTKKAAAPAAAPRRGPIVWLDSLAKGYTAARESGRPLFIKTSASWCEPCRQLDEELIKAVLKPELGRWTLVTLDVEKSKEEAATLGSDKLPSLHLFTNAGKQVATRLGVLKAEELREWLDENYEAAHWTTPKVLAESGPVTPAQLGEIIAYFSNRDATTREAAIRRLLPHPDVAAVAVVETFSDGKLGARLSALELLSEWKAPLQGLDPWRPESLDREKLKKLSEWSSHRKAEAAVPRTALTAVEMQEARALMARMATVNATEAAAIRERLARHGALLLPAVKSAAQQAETDEIRERLLALRYRLVMSDALALGWSGGVERLASGKLETRRDAADELSKQATSAEEALLRELFSDPAPIVREISLKTLRSVGGANARSALLELLVDPELNIRAAVLKELSEKPPAGILPRIIEYASAEQDPDLLVHAIRVMRESNSPAVLNVLMKLLEHDSWRVRAEAAEAVGKLTQHNSGNDSEKRADVLAALIKLLSDQDGFVVSRAVEGLGHADLEIAVGPLAAAAETHPELAVQILKSISTGQNSRGKAAAHVQRLLKHQNPTIRGAAARALCQQIGMMINVQEELVQALRDPEAEVRIATALGIFESLHSKISYVRGNDEFAEVASARSNRGPPLPPVSVENESGSFLGSMIKRLFSRKEKPAVYRAPPATPDFPQPEFAPEPQPPRTPAKPAAVKPTAQAPEPAWVQPTLLAPEKVSAAGEDQKAKSKPRPAAEASSPPPQSQGEEIVQGLRKKQGLSPWVFNLREPLLPLLKGATSRERLAAAIALVALGTDAESLPVLRRELPSGREARETISKALPWMLWEDRLAFYRSLIAASTDPAEFAEHFESLAAMPDRHLLPLLWEMLGSKETSEAFATKINEHLRQEYTGPNRYNIEKISSRRRQFIERETVPRVKSGTPWQRVVALQLLTEIDKDQAVELAEGITADKAADGPLRRGALALLLSTQKPAKATKTVVESLSGPMDKELRKLCLSFLAQGANAGPVQTALQWGGGNPYRNFGRHRSPVADTDVGAVDPPAGLSAEPLFPLLKDSDPEMRALAGYLLALLERPEGLPPLLEYWKKNARQDQEWSRLVYRAIAALNDRTQISLLEEIYGSIKPDSGEGDVRDFYWTIRGLTGPEILKLRKRIRDDVGMDRLAR